MSNHYPVGARPRARVEIVPLESSSQPFKFTVHVLGPDTPDNRKLAEELAQFAIWDKYRDKLPGATINYTILFEG